MEDKSNKQYADFTKNITKRLQKLEKRVTKVEIRIEKERKKGEGRYWYAVAAPILVVGIFTLIKAEDTTGRFMGSLVILVALYIMVILGTDLGLKFDQWTINFFNKLRRKLRIRKGT